jgi:hypothetical protein
MLGKMADQSQNEISWQINRPAVRVANKISGIRIVQVAKRGCNSSTKPNSETSLLSGGSVGTAGPLAATLK